MELGEPVIECRDVTKWYGTFRALSNVSFTVERGEVVVIIGPSGSGKSTLLRCINRLEMHTSGEIYVDGVRVSNSSFAIRRVRDTVGMVFQSFNLFPHLTVTDNVAIAPILVRRVGRSDAKRDAKELLAQVGMAAHARKYPAQLSGGEQQRVAIARALAMRPQVMLFDEPTSAIDPELTKGIMELISEVATRGMTTLIVTHEMGFAREMATRILFFDAGELVEEGPPSRLLAGPRDSRTQRFLAQVPTLWPGGVGPRPMGAPSTSNLQGAPGDEDGLPWR